MPFKDFSTMLTFSEIRNAVTRFTEDLTIPETLQEVVDIFKSCFDDENLDVVKPTYTIEDTLTSSYSSDVFPVATEDYRLQSLVQREDATTETVYRKLDNICPYYDIIVRFPHETVTNEMNESTEIYNLFIRIRMRRDGTMFNYPEAKKSSFTIDQLCSGYVHSHVTRITGTLNSNVKIWRPMCFGSGPIVTSLEHLLSRVPEDLQASWIGFIGELKQWTRIESIDGGPYMRIREIGKEEKPVTKVSQVIMGSRPTYKKILKSYIRAGRMKVGFASGKFCLGVPFTEWLIDFSRYAEEWIRQTRQVTEYTGIIFNDILIKDNKIFKQAETEETRRNWLGVTVLTFKGVEVPLTLIESERTVQHMKLIPYYDGVRIVKHLLNTLNYYYGKSNPEGQPYPVFWG